ncbi:(d)CMP kinase [Candidatus Pantoea edessiphila]|uniref:(d)CMP kinase n=1 Tax=Candidatus Pantoea edessiphila TaxID=2044610 RepID=UPI001F540550|nr:(d)CMP kinase [Candidatus Pantoea edessiphila]
MAIPIITIDGPSGAGKSTICKAIGKLLSWNILDSGAIYRSVALLSLNKKLNVLDLKNLSKCILSNFNIKFFYKNSEIRVLLNSKDITDKIREEQISKLSCSIAESSTIRNILIEKQRSFLKEPGLIADGRDMGTVIFPHAPVKIFLDASLEERTRRRKLQLKKKGFNVKFGLLFQEMKKRDEHDYNRKISPLFPATDAIIINSEHISINQIIENILQYAQEKLLFNN